MIALAVAIIVGWIACGVLAYGITLAEFQRSDPTVEARYREDCAFAVFVACFGPAGAFSAYLLCSFARHGLMYRRPKHPPCIVCEMREPPRRP